MVWILWKAAIFLRVLLLALLEKEGGGEEGDGGEEERLRYFNQGYCGN